MIIRMATNCGAKSVIGWSIARAMDSGSPVRLLILIWLWNIGTSQNIPHTRLFLLLCFKTVRDMYHGRHCTSLALRRRLRLLLQCTNLKELLENVLRVG